MRLLLDEHYSALVATRLRELGHDVTAVVETELRGIEDAALLAHTDASRCVLVTENARHMIPLARSRVADGSGHHGLVLTSPSAFPRRRDAVGDLVRSLDALLLAHPAPTALRDAEHWLQGPS